MKAFITIVLALLSSSFASGFAPKRSKFSLTSQPSLTTVRTAPLSRTKGGGEEQDVWGASISDDITDSFELDRGLILPAAILSTALPVEAAGVVPSALWAYGHYLSILAITGCLVAEKTLVKPDMSIDDEDTIVKIDVVYGLMAALLIISGFARAAKV